MAVEERTPIQKLADYIQEHVEVTDRIDPTGVDVGFMGIRSIKGAQRPTFFQLTKDAEHGEFADVSIERLIQGPSYIELGSWLGDQTLALAFMGLGALLDQWNIITPESLGVTDETSAQHMMGMGYLMISPKSSAEMFADAD